MNYDTKLWWDDVEEPRVTYKWGQCQHEWVNVAFVGPMKLVCKFCDEEKEPNDKPKYESVD